MRVPALLPTVFIASATASALVAQQPRVTHIPPNTVIGAGPSFRFYGDETRAIIGVSTTSAATSRDTLGVLVSTVRSGSPAEKAGIEEGNRISSINGVSLKLAAADVGDDQMAGVLSRRLTRELEKLKPGDEVDLRVVASGQTKSVKVKTVSPEELDNRVSRQIDDRPTLGLNLASTGSPRDTIGVFVMSVEDGGPAAKAGIEEGSRIASINGVDLKGRNPDDQDFVFRRSNVTRIGDEVSRLKPGDVADLRVYFNGQSRDVKVTVGRMGDLPRRRSVHVISGQPFVMSPMDLNLDINGVEIGDKVRRAVDAAMVGTGRGMESVGRLLGKLGGRVDW
jgi:S1-C subfamily serine protease